jgi:hypothetical protein
MYHHQCTDPLQASHSPDFDPLRCIITALTHAKASLTTAFVRIFHGMAEYLPRNNDPPACDGKLGTIHALANAAAAFRANFRRIFPCVTSTSLSLNTTLTRPTFLVEENEMGDRVEATSVIPKKADGHGECLSTQVTGMLGDFKALQVGAAGHTNSAEQHLPPCTIVDGKAGTAGKEPPKAEAVAAAAETVHVGTLAPHGALFPEAQIPAGDNLHATKESLTAQLSTEKGLSDYQKQSFQKEISSYTDKDFKNIDALVNGTKDLSKDEVQQTMGQLGKQEFLNMEAGLYLGMHQLGEKDINLSTHAFKSGNEETLDLTVGNGLSKKGVGSFDITATARQDEPGSATSETSKAVGDGARTNLGADDYSSGAKTQEAARRMGLNVTSGFDPFDRVPLTNPGQTGTNVGADDYSSADKTQEAARRMGLNVTSGFDQFDRQPLTNPEQGAPQKAEAGAKGAEPSAADLAPMLDQRPALSDQDLAKAKSKGQESDESAILDQRLTMLDQRPALSDQDLAKAKAKEQDLDASASAILDQRPALSDHDLVTTFSRGQDFLLGKNTTVSGADASQPFPSSQSLENQLRTEVQAHGLRSGDTGSAKKYDAGVLEDIHQIAKYTPEDLKRIGDINNTLLDPEEHNLDKAMHAVLKGIDSATLKRLEPGMELDMHHRLGDTFAQFTAFYKQDKVGLQVQNGRDVETYFGDLTK